MMSWYEQGPELARLFHAIEAIEAAPDTRASVLVAADYTVSAEPDA